MMDNIQAASPAGGPRASAALARTAMIFVDDRESENIIRGCLADLALSGPDIIHGNVDTAIAALKTRASPRLLIVDIHGLDEPVARIQELANVCDPETGVVVIGEANDIRMYRSLKACGVVEYYYKPLVRSLVMETCQGILSGSMGAAPSRGGKAVFIVSVRGGSGGTMIAAATAWYLAETHKRRVGLIDMDLQYGDAALQMDTAPGPGLKEALDHPERVDELFLDRAMIKVGERLGLMAALESLDGMIVPEEPAVTSLLTHMLRRCRFVLMDIPGSIAPDLLHLLHSPGIVILVSTESLAAARDVGRWRDKLGPNTSDRTVLHILNKSGASDGLSDGEFARAAGAKPDMTIPFAKEIGVASRLGAPGLQNCSLLQRSLAPLFRQLSGEDGAAAPRSRLWALFGAT